MGGMAVSAVFKIQLSRLAIIGLVTVLLFAGCVTASLAASLADIRESAEVVAQMNAMQLLAGIAIVSILALVVVIGFYVKSVAAFQKENAAFMATVTSRMSEISTALHAVADKCDRKTCR